MDNVVILLSKPQLAENIGAVARAMMNFGFNELRIINPRIKLPDEVAYATAVKAKSILEKAKIYDDYNTAIADLNFLYATSARDRNLNKEAISSSDIAKDSSKINGKIGILFGPENSGLSNDEISKSDKIVSIDTSPKLSSINLAQSSVIICYEFYKHNLHKSDKKNVCKLNPAKQEDFTRLFEHLEGELEKNGFYQEENKKDSMNKNIRALFKRIQNCTEQDIKTLRGIIKNLSRKRS